MRAAMVLIGLVACGRVGFAPAGDGGGSGDAIGSDATAATCADQPELCNGIDDNCNGQVDEGCPCTPFSVALGQSATAPQLASAILVSTGTDYIIYDLAAAALVHVDYNGNVGATVPLAFDGMYDQVVWDGDALIHASNPAGSGPQIDRVTLDGTSTYIYSIGSEFTHQIELLRTPAGTFEVALVSGASNEAIYAQGFTSAGQNVGDLQPIMGGISGVHLYGLAYAGEPALLWNDDTNTTFFRALGQSDVTWMTTGSASSALAGSPNGFVVVWEAGNTQTITIDPSGGVAGTPSTLAIPVAVSPVVVPNSAGFVVSGTVPYPSAIRFSLEQLDPTGTPSGAVTPFFTSVAYTLSGTVIPNTSIADAVRTAYAVIYELDSTPYQQQLIQTCP